jgi:fructose-bisphosphate aldolase, class I
LTDTRRSSGQSQMNVQELKGIAKTLIAGDKGLLAMDESNPTCNKRFAKLGIPQTVEARRAYRELIVTTPGLGECISGAILYDETIRQQKKDGTPFVKVITDAGIIPGIKVDMGTKDMPGFPGEEITEGLDGLGDRLKEYFQMGARFAKWRAVFAVGESIPSRGCIEANASALARYAALCQEAGLVPIVEPEVLMDGDHPLQRCREATEELNAMNVRLKSQLPWELTFSFARAIQQPALEIWQGQDANVSEAQKALYHRAKCNRAARRGEYTLEMEKCWERMT